MKGVCMKERIIIEIFNYLNLVCMRCWFIKKETVSYAYNTKARRQARNWESCDMKLTHPRTRDRPCL